MDLDYKAEFARQEQKQERAVYLNEMEFYDRVEAEELLDNIVTSTPKVKQAAKSLIISNYKSKLATNKAWALRGLAVIFEHQTADEQRIEATNEQNGVGFTGTDGEFGSSLAKQYLRKGWLSDKQMGFVFKIMPKYATQLYRLRTVK